MAKEQVPSPCIGVCTIDATTGYCLGCLRTLKEVADWMYLKDDDKRAVLMALEERRKRLG